MYEKAFETLAVIKQETEKCYQELRKECETYKELEKAIRNIEWYGEYGSEFLVELLRYKMEEEKSRLPIRQPAVDYFTSIFTMVFEP